MNSKVRRRSFLSGIIGMPALLSSFSSAGMIAGGQKYKGANNLKLSLNAYSFNEPLTNGTMDIFDMLAFCAESGFAAVDITGYYFKGYPGVPDNDYLFQIKRKAHQLGMEISGTGVRNDFTIADRAKRAQEVLLVKKWVEVAAKIGAPVIRIFAGNQKNEGIPKETVTNWLVNDIRECVEYGRRHGVIIGLQNHNDFIQTADEVINIIRAVRSEWLGLILDTGSYRVYDPYEEIEKSIGYTVNWQIKEKLFLNGAETETDMRRLVRIIRASGYNGYLPIETLGPGDPKTKVLALLSKLRDALAE